MPVMALWHGLSETDGGDQGHPSSQAQQARVARVASHPLPRQSPNRQYFLLQWSEGRGRAQPTKARELSISYRSCVEPITAAPLSPPPPPPPPILTSSCLPPTSLDPPLLTSSLYRTPLSLLFLVSSPWIQINLPPPKWHPPPPH